MKFNNILTITAFSTLFIYSCHSTKENYREKTVEINKTNIQEIEIEKRAITYRDQTFNPNIKTVLCHQSNNQLSLAIINLHSSNKILISFDDLDADRKDYYYTIVHCNADWTESDLIQSEYIDGFNEEHISNYEFSFNTIQKYTHYQFEFPSENMKPSLSGNYIFKIYDNNKNNVICKRFMVLDTKLQIDANIRRATLVNNRKYKHEVDFIIKHPNLIIADPFTDIKVHIKQNNMDHNSITDLTPQFIKNDELIYDYEYENTFWGNNEFRHFDFKSLRYQSEKIRTINFDSTYNHIYLFDDKKRPFDRYSINPDINGKFIIESQEAWKSTNEADYAFVHFTLPSDKITYAELYVFGKFSDWEFKNDFKLEYNPNNKKYEGSIYLKQGYYNYHYALNDTNTNHIDIKSIEGTHYQTRNDYYIYVYYRGVGDRYDRLIGFAKSSSKELF